LQQYNSRERNFRILSLFITPSPSPSLLNLRGRGVITPSLPKRGLEGVAFTKVKIKKSPPGVKRGEEG
jgi:hypothetical protein